MLTERPIRIKTEIPLLDNNNEFEIIKEKVKHVGVTFFATPSTFLADERVFPFLGPLKVADQLRGNGNYVEYVDLAGVANYEEVVAYQVKNSPNQVFGITATTPQIPAAVKIRHIIKEVNPRAKVILGGTHVTLTHSAMQKDTEKARYGRGTQAFEQLDGLFDKLVVGDGEIAVFYAIDSDNTDKIIDAGNRKSKYFMPKGSLDHFGIPARDLIDLDSYHYTIDGKKAFSVIGQLGCPYECGFCGGRNTDMLRYVRTRSTGHVIQEIEQVVQQSIERGDPYEAVMFYDDELNVSPGTLENLCDGLIDLQMRLGIEMRFRGFVKANLFTQQQAKKMYQAGFRILLSGVESGSDLILKTMRKKTTRESNARCVDYAHQAGLKFKSLMSIGHPGESAKTIEESVEWALKYLKNGDDIDWTVITLYPGSPYSDDSIYVPEKDAWLYTETHTGNKLYSRSINYLKEAEYYKGIPGEYISYVWTDSLTSDQMVRLRDQAENITREALKLPPISAIKPREIEIGSSMGQGLPFSILRSSKEK